MSTSFGYHCTTCPQEELPDYEDPKNATSEHWINHGDHILSSLAKLRSHIKALIDGDTTGYLEITVMAYGSAPILWLYEHHDHDIELEDEYGRRYNIETSAERQAKRDTEIAHQRARYDRIGPCYMTTDGVYCPTSRSPDHAAGLCSRCGERQRIRDRIAELRKPLT